MNILKKANIDPKSTIMDLFGKKLLTENEFFFSLEGKKYRARVEVLDDFHGGKVGFIIYLKEVPLIETIRDVNGCTKLKVTNHTAKYTFDDILGSSPVILKVKELALKASLTDFSVLLIGESGTGKELFAQAIHNASKRAKAPFLAINCAAIPRDLLASELFGYEEGAFTGAKRGGQVGKIELAQGGTLFLDEIGDMPIDMQAVLLRVLEEKIVVRLGGKKEIPVDVRIIAATNKDLEEEIANGRFRSDLYFRLNVIRIVLPPLRDRREDIINLAKEIAKKVFGKSVEIEKKAQEALLYYHWPGNVRELRNVVESALLNSSEAKITFESLPISVQQAHRKRYMKKEDGDDLVLLDSLKSLELKAIKEAIDFSGGNISQAARILGIDRSTIYRKLRKLGMKV